MTRAVFLDRDGVLNKAIVRDGKPFSPRSVSEMEIVPDAASALNELHRNGFRLILTTNQPDIARGKLAQSELDAMHVLLRAQMPLDAVEVCPHDDADRCGCRKPDAGMLLNAAARDGIILTDSFMVGDRWRDIEAGRRAQCRTVLIGNGYGETFRSQPDAAFATLTEAVDWILAQSPRG